MPLRSAMTAYKVDRKEVEVVLGRRRAALDATALRNKRRGSGAVPNQLLLDLIRLNPDRSTNSCIHHSRFGTFLDFSLDGLSVSNDVAIIKASKMKSKSPNLIACVTGGGGFLGSVQIYTVRDMILQRTSHVSVFELAHLVDLLCALEEYSEIRVIDLKPFSDEFSDMSRHRQNQRPKVIFYKGSITDVKLVERALSKVDVVFHVAAIVDWGQQPPGYIFEVNLKGTEIVTNACLKKKVSCLVFTSTMDVVCWRGKHHYGVTDDEAKVPPTPSQFLYGAYAVSKAAAERAVLSANSSSLRTTSLRVTGMYGERDPWHLPNVLKAAESGALCVRLG
eukprot:gene9737-1940_t